MTTQDKIKKIVEECAKVNPDIKECTKSLVICGKIPCSEVEHQRDIQLADVLLMIGKVKCGELVDFKLYDDNIAKVILPNWDIDFNWNLTKPLHLQSTPTIDCIYNIIPTK